MSESPILLSGLEQRRANAWKSSAQNAAGVWQAEADATVATWIVNTSCVARTADQRSAGAEQRRPVSRRDIPRHGRAGQRRAPAPIDLLDMSVTDDPNAPRKFVFTTHVMLAPGQRLDSVCQRSGRHQRHSPRLRARCRRRRAVRVRPAGGRRRPARRRRVRHSNWKTCRLCGGPTEAGALGTPTFGAANTFLPMGNPQQPADQRVAGDRRRAVQQRPDRDLQQ